MKRRRPPDWRQPSLFPPEPVAESDGSSHTEPEGGNHALQDHRPESAGEQAPDARGIAEGTQATRDTGDIHQGAEGQPRVLDGHPPAETDSTHSGTDLDGSLR